MSRDIRVVLDRILAEVPPDFVRRDDLVSGFLSIKRSSLYRAPEISYLDWDTAARELEEILGPPDTPWKEKIVQIFAAAQ